MTTHLTKTIFNINMENYLTGGLQERINAHATSTIGTTLYCDFPRGKDALQDKSFKELLSLLEQLTGVRFKPEYRGD